MPTTPKIKQIKKNEDSFFHYYLFVGLNSSQLNIYTDQDFAYRNSTYYGLGLTFPLKRNFSFKSNVLYSKNGNKKWYTAENETGREKIVYNTMGLELLVNKKFNFFNFFTGLKTDYAAKRERILLSRKWYGFTFRDDYIKLDNLCCSRSRSAISLLFSAGNSLLLWFYRFSNLNVFFFRLIIRIIRIRLISGSIKSIDCYSWC